MKRLSIVVAVAALFVSGAVFAATQSKAHAAANANSHASSAPTGTWKGEVLDAGCYLGHGAMGEKHKECALKCAANGMPLMLMLNGKPVLLTMDHDNADPYNSLKEMAGSVVEVTGKMMTRGGVSGIEVTGAKLAAAK
jgi:hypothetical protein